MLIKFDFSLKKGVLVVKSAFATAILKIETLRMRRRFARVLYKSCRRLRASARFSLFKFQTLYVTVLITFLDVDTDASVL